MPPVRTLSAFSPTEKNAVHELLASVVARMMGRKMEEGDWASVYCRAKGIPVTGWSNLNIDVMHNGLGVEHKMLCYRSDADISKACGETLMHPSATRSIRIPQGRISADRAMRDILQQYADLIMQRTAKVAEQSKARANPDMRTGWLLWQESLRQFLYFEERMVAPNPDDFTAEWVERSASSRKQSRNLWIYEKSTGKKRYSITTSAGAKIQPYFDVPPPSDPNLYIFTVIGEVLLDGHVRCWLSRSTHQELMKLVGSTEIRQITQLVLNSLGSLPDADVNAIALDEPAIPLEIDASAYQLLTAKLHGVNDDHRFQLLLSAARSSQS